MDKLYYRNPGCTRGPHSLGSPFGAAVAAATERVPQFREVKVPIFQKKVMWIPEKVYDDGSHTYIKLPAVVLQNELPTVYEDKENIVNYEVHPTEHNLLIINKLITKLTLRLGKEKITIIKKG